MRQWSGLFVIVVSFWVGQAAVAEVVSLRSSVNVSSGSHSALTSSPRAVVGSSNSLYDPYYPTYNTPYQTTYVPGQYQGGSYYGGTGRNFVGWFSPYPTSTYGGSGYYGNTGYYGGTGYSGNTGYYGSGYYTPTYPRLYGGGYGGYGGYSGYTGYAPNYYGYCGGYQSYYCTYSWYGGYYGGGFGCGYYGC